VAEVLVTGGTGVLGRALVPALRAAGHGVRVLSRRPGNGGIAGDLATGSGVGEAVSGVETVVHGASAAGSRGNFWAVDVAGTRRLVVAAREAGVRHLVYVSIPGVDRVPYSYYHAKYAAEQVVAAAAVPYTVLRATQFYPLIALLLGLAHRASLLPVGAGWRAQPVDAGDVAAHIVERVAVGPAGAVTEFGGPEVLSAPELARAWLAARGARGRVVPLPIPGSYSRAVREGGLLPAPDAPRGTVTWAGWLARTGGDSPYSSQWLRRGS
jgi:uncharacterized protein YbjT (DUF2867 family)